TARLASGERHWLDRHLGARETGGPASSFAADRDGLAGARISRTGPPHGRHYALLWRAPGSREPVWRQCCTAWRGTRGSDWRPESAGLRAAHQPTRGERTPGRPGRGERAHLGGRGDGELQTPRTPHAGSLARPLAESD